MQPQDFAAWFGAIVSFCLLIWDIVKWRNEGPKISLQLSSNMEIFHGGKSDGKKLVFVTAYNNGSAPTTIENLYVEVYKNLFFKVINKRFKAGVVVNQSFGHGIPHVIKPGELWQGGILQSDIDELTKKYRCYVCVKCSFMDKGIMKYLKKK